MARKLRRVAISVVALTLTALAAAHVSCQAQKQSPRPDMATVPPPSDGGAMVADAAVPADGGVVVNDAASPTGDMLGIPDAATSSADMPPSFIALVTDFLGFQSWTRVMIPNSQDPIAGAHMGGPRYIYINKWPLPAGSQVFPVGTIIVKTAGEDSTPNDKTKWEIHAMTKRALAHWNAIGAVGWEWFDLGFNSTGDLVMNWRGTRPPMAGGYACATLPGQPIDLAGDCNTCHVMKGANNDFVINSPLMLMKDGGP